MIISMRFLSIGGYLYVGNWSFTRRFSVFPADRWDLASAASNLAYRWYTYAKTLRCDGDAP